MAAIATGDAGPDAGSGFRDLLDIAGLLRQAAAGSSPRRGHGPRAHPARPRGPGAGRGGHSTAGTVRRAGRAAGGCQPACCSPSGWDGSEPPSPFWPRSGSMPTRRWRRGWPSGSAEPGTVVAETMAAGAAHRLVPPHATRRIKRLMMAGPGPRHRRCPCSRGGGLRIAVRRPAHQPGITADRRPGALSGGAPRDHRIPDRPGHGAGRPGPGRRGTRLSLLLPSRAHPSAGAGRHASGAGRRGPSRRLPAQSRPIRGAVHGGIGDRADPARAPGWCSSPSTTPSCWPSRSPPSTI